MLTADDLERAHQRIADTIVRTPVWRSPQLDAACGRELHLKCELFQPTGAFKLRGATNAIKQLPPGTQGVVTESSGNHAQAIAYAGRAAGLRVIVVMAGDSNPAKRAATEALGATVVSENVDVITRTQFARDLAEREGYAFVHPFDDWHVIAGQSTAALELIADSPALDTIVAPIGGGGLLSGTALACEHRSPATRVFGAEPAGGPDAYESLRTGTRVALSEPPITIADGARTAQLGERTFAVLRDRCAGIHLVSDDEMREALALVWRTTRLLIEPTAAMPIAAILADAIPGARIGVILSGGNVDAAALAATIRNQHGG